MIKLSLFLYASFFFSKSKFYAWIFLRIESKVKLASVFVQRVSLLQFVPPVKITDLKEKLLKYKELNEKSW